MLARQAMFARQAMRNFGTTSVRRSGHDVGGVPGDNLPFNIHNRFTLTAWFIAFFGSGFAIPFLTLRHQMLK